MGVPNDTLWGIRGKEESMALRGNYARKADSTQYAISQVKAIVKALGLHETSEANNNLLMYCPFHSNRHTASFSISCENGAWLCYNPACGESGNLVELVKRILHKNDFEALRFIGSKQNEVLENFDELLEGLMEDKPEFEEFPKETLVKLYTELVSTQEGKDYFKSRGIEGQSIVDFDLGYSKNMGMVTVPVHSPDGIPIGIVGRSIEGKEFKNTPGLPKSKTLFNLHRVKKSDRVYVVESSFDAIRLDQVGLPAVATLGANVSGTQIELLQKYFNNIIVIADNDEAGGNMKDRIVEKLSSRVSVIKLNNEYKDIGDMPDEELKKLEFQFDKSISLMLN